MNPIDAIRLMAKNYPGGVDALAVLCGKSPETLRKEIAEATGYKLGVADACTISEACIAVKSPHCNAYANAVAANCGGFIELPVRDSEPHDMRDSTARLTHRSSALQIAVLDALADGRLSPNEKKALRPVLLGVIEQIQKVVTDLDAEEGSSLRSVA